MESNGTSWSVISEDPILVIREYSFGPGMANATAVGIGDEPLGPEHAGVGPGRTEIVPGERPVEVDGGAEALHRRIRRLGEPAAPGLLRGHPVQISGIVVDFQGRT